MTPTITNVAGIAPAAPARRRVLRLLRMIARHQARPKRLSAYAA